MHLSISLRNVPFFLVETLIPTMVPRSRYGCEPYCSGGYKCLIPVLQQPEQLKSSPGLATLELRNYAMPGNTMSYDLERQILRFFAQAKGT